MSREIAQDLSRKVQVEIGKVLERTIAVAKVVLQPADLFIMMIEAATSLALSTATTVASNASTDAERGALFDKTMDAITGFATADRDRSLRAATQNAQVQA